MRYLITAGPVYGPLDDNKIVSNRSRGIWAIKLAEALHEQGDEVTLLLPDTHPTKKGLPGTVRFHRGFDAYQEICSRVAPSVDGAVMAAAVVNWIPAKPFPGKMATKGFEPGEMISVPFVLAPRILAQMRPANASLNLVGCKLTSGVSQEELIDIAYELLLDTKCNAVVANDLSNLKSKCLVYPDRTVIPYHLGNENTFIRDVTEVLQDRHFRTLPGEVPFIPGHALDLACKIFDGLVDKYRDRFVTRTTGAHTHTFGSLAVKIWGSCWLCSGRHKDAGFTSKDAVLARLDRDRVVVETHRGKATLNAPRLMSMGNQTGCRAVVHFHEQLPGVETIPYAPPGTVRDLHKGYSRQYNIRGHGCISDAELV